MTLETVLPLKGVHSARVTGVDSSYLEEDFTAATDLYVSFYLRLEALPISDVRVVLLSNDGTTVGNIVIRNTGRLRLRVGSTIIGAESAPLVVGQLYRVGLHQRAAQRRQRRRRRFPRDRRSGVWRGVRSDCNGHLDDARRSDEAWRHRRGRRQPDRRRRGAQYLGDAGAVAVGASNDAGPFAFAAARPAASGLAGSCRRHGDAVRRRAGPALRASPGARDDDGTRRDSRDGDLARACDTARRVAALPQRARDSHATLRRAGVRRGRVHRAARRTAAAPADCEAPGAEGRRDAAADVRAAVRAPPVLAVGRRQGDRARAHTRLPHGGPAAVPG